jgi:hypothetical protein
MTAVNVTPEPPDVMTGSSNRDSPNDPSDRAAQRPRRGLGHAIRTHRFAFSVLIIDGICAGLLAIVSYGRDGGTGTRAGLLVTIVVFIGTALQTITASAGQLAENADELEIAKRGEETARVDEEKSRRVATDVHLYYSERLPSLLEYLCALHAEPLPEKRREMVESLESLVVDSAATLYGKKDLRAVVLHYDAGRLLPGKFRRGFDSMPPPQLDGAGHTTRQAVQLMHDSQSVCVENPDDPLSAGSLALRPIDAFRSYIRVPIVAGAYGYGILWVDGQDNNSLMKADVASLRALAFILASALAVTVDSQNRLSRA